MRFPPSLHLLSLLLSLDLKPGCVLSLGHTEAMAGSHFAITVSLGDLKGKKGENWSSGSSETET